MALHWVYGCGGVTVNVRLQGIKAGRRQDLRRRADRAAASNACGFGLVGGGYGQAGCKLLCQVQDLAGAALAVEAGADVIVAQGTEGGGHGGKRSSLPFIPAVVDAAGSIPVVAAGGIADGRGLAAVLALGAQGAMLGTRFYASREAVGTDAAKQFIATRSGGDTQRTSVFDVARGYAWPEGVTGRAIRNPFVERWHGREQALADDEPARSAFLRAVKNNDYDASMVWAGENIDLIRSVEPAAAIVDRIVAEAEAVIARVGRLSG